MISNGDCITEHYKTGSAPRRWYTGTAGTEKRSVVGGSLSRKLAAAVGSKTGDESRQSGASQITEQRGDKNRSQNKGNFCLPGKENL